MYDLVKCSRCKKTFIVENFREHVCTPAYRGSKRILIDYHSISKDERGRTRIMAVGMEGITYWLTVNDQPSIPIPFNPSDESLQRKNPTDSGQNLPMWLLHLSTYRFGLLF